MWGGYRRQLCVLSWRRWKPCACRSQSSSLVPYRTANWPFLICKRHLCLGLIIYTCKYGIFMWYQDTLPQKQDISLHFACICTIACTVFWISGFMFQRYRKVTKCNITEKLETMLFKVFRQFQNGVSHIWCSCSCFHVIVLHCPKMHYKNTPPNSAFQDMIIILPRQCIWSGAAPCLDCFLWSLWIW